MAGEHGRKPAPLADLDYGSLRSEFLRAHLRYVESSEPPRLFHVWAALACISACMGRHLYLDTGIGKVFGNMYVLLVGPPGTRKNTAIKFSTALMQDAADVRMAPDDTGGQRQGLITALLEDETDEDGADIAEVTDVTELVNALETAKVRLNGVDRHVMFVKATEFGSFIGQNSLDLTRFLIKMWDGEDYKYQLRNNVYRIPDPLLSLVGGTTPTDIATLLPAEAIGQGFMSRCVLVYAPHKEKEVPPSQARLQASLEEDLSTVYQHVWYNMHGSMTVAKSATEIMDHLYLYETRMQDTRFIYYTERRQTHLLKLAMALAAARQSMIIDEDDVTEAHEILKVTEARMPDALGEYGLSPVAVAKQKMLEYLRYARDPISERVLWAVMQRDMRLVDFKNSISALINAGKIIPVDTAHGTAYVYKDSMAHKLEQLPDDVLDSLLAEGGNNDGDGNE